MYRFIFVSYCVTLFFFRELGEMKRDALKMDVEQKMLDLCMEVLRLIIEIITDNVLQRIYQFTPHYGTLKDFQGELCHH